MIMKPLKMLCSLNMGQSPNSSTYNKEERGLPFFQGNADFGEIHPHVRIWCSSPVKIAEPGDILISVRAPIGAMNVALEKCCIGRGLAALTVNSKKCIQKYLYYALQSKRNSLIDKGTGSTFKAISKKVLEEMPIPAYTLSEQRRISEILSEIDQLIAHRKEQLSLSEKLVKSRFVEMFGEAKSNPHGWQIVEIGSLARSKISNGFFAKSSDYSPSGNAFVLGVRDIVNRMYSNCSNLPKAKASESDFAKYSVAYGDVLFCRSSLVAEGIGKASIIPREVPDNTLFECHVIRLQLDLEKCSPEFIQVQTTTEEFRQQVKSKAKTSTMTTISQSGIASSSVMLPPLKAQNRFKRFVEQINKSKFASRQCLLKTRKLSNLDSDVFA